MPVTTPGIKVDAVRRLGATVEMVGESYTETQSHAQVSSVNLTDAAKPVARCLTCYCTSACFSVNLTAIWRLI